MNGEMSLFLPQTLSLTCTVCGDPKPQVSWLKNGADVEPDDQVKTLLPCEQINSRRAGILPSQAQLCLARS